MREDDVRNETHTLVAQGPLTSPQGTKKRHLVLSNKTSGMDT